MKRIGVFGGTFDPIHTGHLILAEQCRETGRLDEVWFVPAGNPPHKQGHGIAPFEQRVEMIELAVAGQPAFRVDPIEQTLPGKTYTAETLEILRRRHPDTEMFLLVGSDSLNDLPRWYEPHRIVAAVGLMVMLRPSHPVKSEADLRRELALSADVPLRIEHVPQPPMFDIAGTDIRRRVQAGRTIRYLVPRAVECYIHEKKVYR